MALGHLLLPSAVFYGFRPFTLTFTVEHILSDTVPLLSHVASLVPNFLSRTLQSLTQYEFFLHESIPDTYEFFLLVSLSFSWFPKISI